MCCGLFVCHVRRRLGSWDLTVAERPKAGDGGVLWARCGPLPYGAYILMTITHSSTSSRLKLVVIPSEMVQPQGDG